MSFHGGFGAVVYLRASLIQDLIKAAHFRHGDRFRAATQRTFSAAGQEVNVSGAVFLECPRLSLRRGDGGARVSLSAWARLNVALPQIGVAEECIVHLAAEVLAPLAFDFGGQPLSVSIPVILDLSQFSLLSADVAIPWVSADPQAHLRSLSLEAPLRDLLVDAVRPLAQKFLRINVPVKFLDQMQLNLITQAMVLMPQLRPAAIAVFDDCLAVGFDVFAGVERQTTGNANALELPWDAWAARAAEQRVMAGRPFPMSPEEANLVVALEPLVLERFCASNLRLQLILRGGVSERTRLNEAAIKLNRGFADLILNVTRILSDPFSDVTGTLIASLVPMHDYLHLLRSQVDHDASPLLEHFAILIGEIDATIREMVNANLNSNLRQVNWLLPDVRFGGDLPFAAGSPGRAKIYVRHQSTAIDPDWALVGVKASIEMVDARNNFQPDEDLEDPNGLARMSVLAPPQQFARSFIKVHIRDRFLTLKVGEHPTMRRDPSLRMRWSVIVHKPDGTASEIAPVDQWSDQAGSRALALDLWEPEVHVATRLDIHLDYYRPPFDPATVVFSDSREGIPILDRFRRDLPFVRWVTSVSWETEVDGEMVTERKLRKSAVHKTDVRERCKFCDTGSEVGDTYDYFETLPPVERGDMRTQLCHYCFHLPTR